MRLEDLRSLEERVGHPGKLLETLVQKIQDDAITDFVEIEADWLILMWSIDAYRIAGISPRGMGNIKVADSRRLAAVYREKGNWFARVIALLLQNQTHQVIDPKGKVQGFSQEHRIDVAWPAREEDPLVCIGTKVTGAPAYGDTPQRGAVADFTNRRKEVKFAATDLKLYRSQQSTRIDNWDAWRGTAPPKSYFLWAARLRGGKQLDHLATLIREAEALVDTYLEGAGILAWRERSTGDGYEVVSIPRDGRVTRLDDVIHRVAAEIRDLVGPAGVAPAPHVPAERVVDVESIQGDTAHD
jgi:hypothetical protein